jgi:hypothetical protein
VSAAPLFALSLVFSLVFDRQLGLGGIGSAIVGAIMAKLFARRPSFTFWETYKRGLVPMFVICLVLSFPVGFGVTADAYEAAGLDHAGASWSALGMLTMQAVLYAVTLGAVWAAAVVWKARKLRDGAAAQVG